MSAFTLSGLAERAGILLAVGSRTLFDIHGRAETRRIRSKSAVPNNSDQIPLSATPTEYDTLRVDLLVDFIDRNRLDTLVIVGSAYGRELVPLSKRIGSRVAIVGADMSERAIEACRAYNLPKAKFVQINVEDLEAVKTLLANLSGRVGVYMCETAPYILPEGLGAFLSLLYRSDVAAVQFLEPTYLDWASRFSTGAVFSFRDGHWRHNYYRMVLDAGFKVDKTELYSGTLRGHFANHPMWLVSASR